MNIKKLLKNKKGFTLIEIIVVIVILAVLMAVAVPSVMKYIDEADDAKYMTQASAALTVAQVEIAKEWIASTSTTRPTTWESVKEDLDGIGGTPTITKITATVGTNGAVTQVVATFADKIATITPNGEVVLSDPTTPAS